MRRLPFTLLRSFALLNGSVSPYGRASPAGQHGASSLKTYPIGSRSSRCFSIIAVLLAAYLLLALGASGNQNMLFFLALVIAFTCVELQNSWASVNAGTVVLEWDGWTLNVLHKGGLVATLDGARWVYRERDYVVIAAGNRMKRFNYGHVRSNSAELTITGFYGTGLDDLPERLAGLGPAKERLLRRLPFAGRNRI